MHGATNLLYPLERADFGLTDAVEAILAAVLGYAVLAAWIAGAAVLLMRWLKIDVVSAAVLSTFLVVGLGALYFGVAMYLGAA